MQALLREMVRAFQDIAKETGWTGLPHQSNMDYGPNVASRCSSLARYILDKIPDEYK